MTKRNRCIERTARRLFELLGETQDSRLSVELPTTAWQECERLSKLIAKAEARDWSAAARRMCQQFATAQQMLVDRLAALQRNLQLSSGNKHQATIGDVYRDLQALQDEFVSVEYDRPSRQLTVTTEEIGFDDLGLGPFDIVLDCHRLGDVSPYRVVARDVNPAGTDSRTTHPHVQDDTLCEGDGRISIERALQQGRLYDFFLIVRQILSTYNSSSAYISIHDWHGIRCRDCDTTMDEEDRDVCSRCEANLCCDCSHGCSRCSERYCDGCTEVCEACYEYHCPACLQVCDKCDVLFCERCLTNEKCPKCIEKEETEEKELSSAANTQVHAVCLGEAALSP